MKNILLSFFLLVFLVSCAPATASPTPPPATPTSLPPSNTPLPPNPSPTLPAPSATPVSSATPAPSSTPIPSATPTRAQPTLSPTPTFPPTATLRPGARLAVIGAAAVYDPKHDTLLTFGGALVNPLPPSGGVLTASDTVTAETWGWFSLTGWQLLDPPTSPPARRDATLVYDRSTQQVLLFGGYSPTEGYLNDTWLWDGKAWTQQSPSQSPSPRSGAVIACDAAHNNIILFGGINEANGSKQYLKDTWLWENGTWVETDSSGPWYPKTDPPGMVYDSNNARILMWQPGEGLWVWDGQAWSGPQVSENGPSIHSSALVTYDTMQLQIILLEKPDLAHQYKVWTGSGTRWKAWDTGDDPATTYPGDLLVYHSERQQALLLSPQFMPGKPIIMSISYWEPFAKAWIQMKAVNLRP